jgi:hypothetical protein
MSPDNIREIAEQFGPAAVGTAASMLFTDGSWKKRLVQGAVGIPFSIYMAPSVGTMLARFGWPLEPEAVGALTACFGLAAVSYVFELWKQMHLGPLLRRWIAKWLGVKDDV